MIRRAWSDLAAAVRFLTVVPLPGAAFPGACRGGATELPDRGGTTAWFPAVGLGLGVVLLGLRSALPGEGLLAPALVLTAWTALTGGLHEDGWVDCADAALPPVDRARRLEILRDPRVGAHGLVAVVLLLVVRLAALAESPAWGLLVAPVVGRWAMVLSLAWSPPLRPTGLGASMAAGARPGAASGVAAAALIGAASVAAPAPGVPWMVLAAVLGGGVGGAGVGVFLQARFGGLSGDGHGAVGLAAETAALCCLALPLAGVRPGGPL